MKKSVITLLLIFVSVLTISAQSKSKNKRIIYTTTPEMHCQGCEDKITGNLRFVKGVKIIQTNRANQTVTITYDSTKCTSDALVEAFGKIKYTVKEVDPESLPSCCSGETHKENAEGEDKKK